jgi:hypothetical protein
MHGNREATMNTALMILLAVGLVGVVYVLLPIGIDTYLRLRGPRLVTCPETQAPVEIDLDARFGALTALSGRPALRVKECGRWQDTALRTCAQGCLCGIDALAAQEHGLLTRPLTATGATLAGV